MDKNKRHAPETCNPQSATQACRPAVLTIAGSDSGGGAGIQADLQTFAAAGVFGTCAITCLTAQNPDTVTAIRPVDTDMIAAQIAAVWDAFPVQAVKTGMLYSADIIAVVAAEMRRRQPPVLVVDPVMVAGSGARLLRDDAVDMLQTRLLPAATVVTPNIHEAEILAGAAISDIAAQQRAAVVIAERWNIGCVLKGGHLADGSDEVVNVTAWRGRVETWRTPRLRGAKTHGTGCTFAAAMTAALALDTGLFEAAAHAGRAVVEALTNRPAVGAHYPLNWRAIRHTINEQ